MAETEFFAQISDMVIVIWLCPKFGQDRFSDTYYGLHLTWNVKIFKIKIDSMNKTTVNV